MKLFNQLQFIKQLLECSPRQLEGETKAGNVIIKILQSNNIPYIIQKFNVYIPKVEKAELRADGKKIDCMATSFMSGKIHGKEKIISSMYNFDTDEMDLPNINFNPYCRDIACVTHYFAPAIAIKPKDIVKLVVAKKVFGEVKIKKTLHKSRNIIVGNLEKPNNIFFTHYDSINLGAFDNASGVSVLMDAIISRKKILKKNLFVFAGAEELSYDKPIYWAHGYRIFEKKYLSIMKKSNKIICVDGVGAGTPLIIQDNHFLHQAFPIKNIKRFQNKILGIGNRDNILYPVYHSDLDNIQMIKIKYLKDTTKKIIQISNN